MWSLCAERNNLGTVVVASLFEYGMECCRTERESAVQWFHTVHCVQHNNNHSGNLKSESTSSTVWPKRKLDMVHYNKQYLLEVGEAV